MNTIKNEDVISADLLSVEEALEIPEWILANGDWWWLQSPGYWNDYVDIVLNDGDISTGDDVYSSGYYVNQDRNVRPALKVSNLSELEIGDLVEVLGLKAQYIGNDKVLLCESIFNSRFDCESNIYETSEVKKKLDDWFMDKKGEEDG